MVNLEGVPNGLMHFKSLKMLFYVMRSDDGSPVIKGLKMKRQGSGKPIFCTRGRDSICLLYTSPSPRDG